MSLWWHSEHFGMKIRVLRSEKELMAGVLSEEPLDSEGEKDDFG